MSGVQILSFTVTYLVLHTLLTISTMIKDRKIEMLYFSTRKNVGGQLFPDLPVCHDFSKKKLSINIGVISKALQSVH